MARSTPAQDEAQGPWRNRILGSGMEDPTQLLANPRNWRTHPMRQRMFMRGALKEIGWVQQVIVNQRTGRVVDGHLRIEEAISAHAPTVPVLYVDLSEEEEGIVLATLDPLGALAGQSDERLQELLAEVHVEDDALERMLASMARRHEETYTDKVAVLRYEPQEDTPPVGSLRDETKASELRTAILADEDLEPAVREFLLAAAGRHTVFDYAHIAAFYAAAPANVQRHMEASALVIIDLEDAIRDGYVRFASAMEILTAEQDAEGSGEEDDDGEP